MSINVVVSSTAAGVSVSGGTAVAIEVGGGIGPAGFITAPGTATNAFGTFQLVSGDGVTITTNAGQFVIASYSTTQAASFAPVQSVAGRTGAVVLQAADVTAGTFAIARIPTISYTALSNVPATFAPEAHTHGTADVVGLTAAASAAAPVQSVNGLTGAVTIARLDLTAAAEVHTHSTADIVSFTAAASAAAPVQSVAGRTGTISLAAADVSGLAAVATSGSYTSLTEIPVEFTPATHTHDAGDVVSGTLDVARIPTLSYTALSNVPTTFAPEAHTHSTSDVVGLTASFSQVGHTHDYAATAHTHDAADVTSGTLDIARIPTVSYTALSNVPTTFEPVAHTHDYAATSHTHAASEITSGMLDFARLPTIGYTALAGVPTSFAPEAHTHSTADITGYSAIPAQAGANGPLVTDGTAATWATRYSVVDPVLVEGAGMTLSRDTAAGEITIAFAGGTSGIVVSSATPQPLGTAAAGSSGDASRADHVHQLPIISYTALSDVPATFAPSAHTHSTADITGYTLTSVNGLDGAITIAAGDNVTVSTASSTITIAAGGGSGDGGGIGMSYLFG